MEWDQWVFRCDMAQLKLSAHIWAGFMLLKFAVSPPRLSKTARRSFGWRALRDREFDGQIVLKETSVLWISAFYSRPGSSNSWVL